MARLKDIASRHNVNLHLDVKETMPSANLETNNNKPVGKIRRPWMEDCETPISKIADEKPCLNPVLIESINPVQTLFKPGSNLVDKQGLIFDSKQGLNSVDDLRGNPLRVITSLINSLSKDEPYITKKMSVTDIANNAGISRESVKTALKFLKEYELIKHLYSHTGVHGWTIYKIKKEIIDDFIKQGLNTVSTGAINSSSNYLKTTTISKTNNIEKGDTNEVNNNNQLKWDEIDITPLENIGLNMQIIQSLKGKNTPEIVQESIYQFAFGLKNNGDAKKYEKNARNVLVGRLMTGHAWTEAYYKSPQEIALEKLVEQKRAEKERIKKLEDEMILYEFEEWLLTIDELKRNEIVGEIPNEHLYRGKMRESIVRGKLLEYFKQKVKLNIDEIKID